MSQAARRVRELVPRDWDAELQARCRAWLYPDPLIPTESRDRTYVVLPPEAVTGVASYDGYSTGSAPDRAYDRVAATADLMRALAACPPLQRTAGEWSRANPKRRGWYAEFARTLAFAHGETYLAWLGSDYACLERDCVLQQRRCTHPLPALLTAAAATMARYLTAEWLRL